MQIHPNFHDPKATQGSNGGQLYVLNHFFYPFQG